jgi:hypothetical protein
VKHKNKLCAGKKGNASLVSTTNMTASMDKIVHNISSGRNLVSKIGSLELIKVLNSLK